MEQFNEILGVIDNYVWGIPLIVLILAVGILLTIRVGILQIHKLPLALKFMVSNESEGEGEVSSFGALCTALSATIGTGNIVGVATAIAEGGPGALFWMEVAAFFGMATKYSEGLLAVKYREVGKDGKILGGPFYYIEKGMGKKWTWLAKIFAVFAVLAGIMGIGTITQINGITSAVQNFFESGSHTVAFRLGGMDYSWSVVISGILVTLCVALVVIGGIKRISKVSEIIVPFMAVLYFATCLILILTNITRVPEAIAIIVKSAFSPKAVFGGAIGITIKSAMQKGISRGIFSNEAGLGSAPIAAAAAQTKEPVRQGLVCMTGTFFDTIVICTMTGLSVVLTGAYKDAMSGSIKGAAVTTQAFETGLPFPNGICAFLLMICLIFFAFTTILGWDYYSERCLQYLVGDRKKVLMVYKILYIAAVFIGPYLTISFVWTLADIFNGLMAIPNLVALFALSGVVSAETKDFFKRHNADKKSK
ncbi:MAG: sodium:alanine symporter family protein [Clostridia bacterium]|nr:sodium:alanine symporter family protein [Clostridia bacterium]